MASAAAVQLRPRPRTSVLPLTRTSIGWPTGCSSATTSPTRSCSELAGAESVVSITARHRHRSRAPRFSCSAARSSGVGSRRVRCQPARSCSPTASIAAAGNTEVQHAARVADLDVEAEEQHDLVRRRHLQHLRPRFAAADAEAARRRSPRQVSVRFSSSSFTTASMTFCSISVSGAVDADAAAGAAEHAVDHREGDRRVELERGRRLRAAASTTA